MMKKMRAQSIAMVFFFVLALCGSVINTSGAETVADKCGKEVSKVGMCLNFATGKAATPSKECCKSVEDIRNSDPECLCYVIQQAHNGNEQIKSLGIQEAKLLQLPSACNLANTNVSDCPRLLNIPAGSPDAAIFTNSSSSSATPTSLRPNSTQNDSSSGIKHGPYVAGPVPVAVAIFFYAVPSWAYLYI